MLWRDRNSQNCSPYWDHIEIKDNLSFLVTPVLKNPFAFKSRLERERKCMVEVRLWLDREHLYLPTAKENLSQMWGNSFLNKKKLDYISGFWKITLDKENSNLLTFGSLSHAYRIKRLRYWIHFQNKVWRHLGVWRLQLSWKDLGLQFPRRQHSMAKNTAGIRQTSYENFFRNKGKWFEFKQK